MASPPSPSSSRVVSRLVCSSVALLLLGACATASTSGSTGVPASSGSQESSGSQSSSSGAGAFLDRPLPPSLEQVRFTDQHGTSFTLASLRGKTVVLTDFLTLCSEICPLTTVNMERAQQAEAARGHGSGTVFVEVTVDPQRDSVSRLKAYAALYGPGQRVRFATARADGLAALWKYLGVYYSKTKPDADATDWQTGKPLTYDVAHQDIVFVLGPDGHERWADDGTPDTEGHAPPTTLRKFLSAEGRQNLTAPTDPTWSAGDIEAAVAQVAAHPTG